MMFSSPTKTMKPSLFSKVANTPISQPSKPSFEDVTNLIQYLSLERSYHKLESIASALKSPDTEDALLISWLKQLKDNIFILDRDNEHLVAALLDLDWTSRGKDVSNIYKELMLNIVSAHTYYLQRVLRMILTIFSDGNLQSNDVLKNTKYKKTHSLLNDIFCLVPKAADVMCRLLAQQFPYMKRQENIIFSYVVNALHIGTYLPSHRMILLECIIDKYILLDVHCPRATIETTEQEKEESDQICDMEIDEAPASPSDMAFPLAKTLDLLMDCMFAYIKQTCHPKSVEQLDWDATKKLYRELLTVFDKVVLPTSQSCHVPFIMFYTCSLRSALCDGFLDFLWKKVVNPNVATIRKQLATYYIGSLLARALFTNIETVVACLNLMCNWIHSYINNYDGHQSGDVGVHGTFYSVCQTIYYVFAFRHKELIDMENGYKYLRSLNFERIVSCRLNPLKFCQPTIMQNFANIARNYQIAYCLPIIERNNRNLARSTVDFSSLSMFFPFDPYLLKRSKKWIDPIYRIYDAQNEDESIEKEDDQSFLDESAHASEDLFSYGHSPGFKHHSPLLQR